MNGFIKYFENNKKSKSFLADDDVILNSNKTGEKLKSQLVLNLIANLFMMKNTLKLEQKLLKKKLLQNLQMIKSLKKILIILVLLQFFIDSVIKLEKENYPQVNLEQCKFRLKKKKNIDLFNDESIDSSDDSEFKTEQILLIYIF